MRTLPRRTFALAGILLLALPLTLPLAPAAAPEALLVGFAPGEPPAALAQAPGALAWSDAAAGLARIETRDAGATRAALLGEPGVLFVEPDGAAHAEGVSANGASWDSSRWDSSRWDSSRWDSSRWDSSRWDSSRWDSSRWDSSRWDSSRWDSSRWDSSRWDSSRWDGAFEPDPLLGYQWGLVPLQVPLAWETTAGNLGRTICFVDSGIDLDHPDLAPNLATLADGSHGRDFVDEDTTPQDAAGHGTHVAGVAAAAVGNGIGTAGVGNHAILAARVLNDEGVGGLGNLARAIRWCADEGAHVISMSLSTHQDSRAVANAVAYAQERGALLIASAGNLDACADCASYPAAYPGVLGVTALALDGAHAGFAQAGPHVDFAAPGELIAGPYLDGGYALGSGTSQATALVAGVAALAWEAAPERSAAEIADAMRASAVDALPAGWDPATGWGIPDAARLVAPPQGP